MLDLEQSALVGRLLELLVHLSARGARIELLGTRVASAPSAAPDERQGHNEQDTHHGDLHASTVLAPPACSESGRRCLPGRRRPSRLRDLARVDPMFVSGSPNGRTPALPKGV